MAKNLGGRPLKEIDQRTFESLCGIQCTKEEVCFVLETTEKTLEAWCKRTYGKGFSQIFAEKRGVGRVSLRRSGFQMAQKNAAVHIFYAKNFLGMRDTVEAEFNPESLKRAKELLDSVDSVIE